jgi:sulfate permease, SulP family
MTNSGNTQQHTPQANGTKPFRNLFSTFLGDFFGGTAAMLVALPSAIAFGLIIYAPLGAEFSSRAAIGGIAGTIALGLFASIFGGTKNLVSAPCAPAAAVLSLFVADLVHGGSIPPDAIVVYITLVSFLAGVVQLVAGNLGGGKFIKYIPYPVVAGYLSAVGILIIIGQLLKFLGIPKGIAFWTGLLNTGLWRWESIFVGLCTVGGMLVAPKIVKIIPPSILALLIGILAYFGVGLIDPSLLTLNNNPFVIGKLSVSLSDLYDAFIKQWSSLGLINPAMLAQLIAPVFTLAILLSIDTLKTCVVLDAVTQSRHDSNRELIGQGIGNMVSASICGIPGAGTMGATIVNINSGARTKMSGMVVGLSALLVLLLLGNLIAWIPVSALAGILIVVGYRMVDKKSFALLKHHSTRFDFIVILAVIITAVSADLLIASGVGIIFAIILFLREQMRSSVIRKKFRGNEIFSKKVRPTYEVAILEKHGNESIVLQLQGQLFFGTTDQLLNEIDPYLSQCKYILLDMRRVQSVDYTAAHMLEQVHSRLQKNHGYLIFASVPLSLPTGQNVRKYLMNLGVIEATDLKFFDDIDSAVEWIEEQVLRAENAERHKAERVLALTEIELFSDFSQDALTKIAGCLKEKSYSAGDEIFGINVAEEDSDEMFFIKKGTVKILLPLHGGNSYHIVSFTRGGFFGDMSFLDKGKRSANAVAADEVILYILSRKEFDGITAQNPEIAGKFFEKMALVISHRLRQNNIELKALQEN